MGESYDQQFNGDDVPADQTSASPSPTVAEPPSIQLTRLKPVAITSVWPTEPRHFTPWLLANSEYLSEVLGIDVELTDREHAVGSFSLDLIGKEVNTGHPVIVENQFGATDHSHLGQLLTYAGGTDPRTVIWIAETFREQHRAALEWLNNTTVEDVRFFGIRLAAVTMEGGPPGLVAPSLELVVQPNDYIKGVAARENSTGGITKELYTRFWAQMAPHLQRRGWTSGTGTTGSWWSMSAGVPGATWTISFAMFGCRSELYFDHPDAEVNLARWSVMHAQADALRAAFGEGELIFDDLPKNKGCRIETRLPGPKIADEESWPSARAWMLDTQERLRRAVATVGGVPPVGVGSQIKPD